MSKEAILKIRETEARAEEMIADARRRAQALLDEARANGQALCDAAERESAKAQRDEIAKAEKKNDALLANGERDSLREVEELQKDAALKKKIAEKIILRGLEEKCR